MHKDLDSDDVRRLMMGDQAAFEKIYDLCSEKLFRLAFRFLKDTEQSEEIVQETFINLWLNREKLDSQGNIWLYLYVVGKRLSLNALRNISQSKLHTEKLLANFTETQNYTEELVFAHDLELLTERVIGDLPKQQQIIFRLSRFEGFSHKEIADQLNISPNTVKNHMGTALKTIKSRLGDCGLICLFLFLFK
ncbi:RNA polymerase sigma factor [Mucilaginibacter paludis]|uniref:RNA polymerase, sigma-24 subunit, ECF subfamily n=1 Tax=Mucilaginibacter paludis DSM 18603 TaxID=714943 RepID=H1YA27_9SPHI|nr:RNA polymerase sigma-70 factor [Mucilaginibacter paludis]EHQ25011.1 RNA polymerase, sigma-24 subunit, ECF subfamily [Mucilaginibacter paludis DSM 18603]